jgi:hypothetical protein
MASHEAAPSSVSESRALLAAREHLAKAEASYGTAEGLAHLDDGLGLLDELIAAGARSERPVAKNVAAAYATKIYRSIGALLERDRGVPEPQLEHLFKVILAFDQVDIELPENAREVKIEIARRLIDRYYEGHSQEVKRKAVEELMKIAK